MDGPIPISHSLHTPYAADLRVEDNATPATTSTASPRYI